MLQELLAGFNDNFAVTKKSPTKQVAADSKGKNNGKNKKKKPQPNPKPKPVVVGILRT